MNGSQSGENSLNREPPPKKGAGIRSLSRRLAMGLTTAVGLVSAITFLVLYLGAIHEEEANLIKKADEHGEYLVGALELPVWNYDTPTVETICRTFLQNELVVGVAVKDTSGLSIHAIGRGRDPDGLNKTGKIYYRGKLLGDVEINFTKRYVKEAGRRLLTTYTTTMLFVLISLAFLTHLLVRKFLKKPIDTLDRIVRPYAAGKYDLPMLELPYLEFQAFGSTLAQMAETIRLQMMEIRGAEEKYRSIFENAIEGIFQSLPEGRYLSVNPALANLFGYDSPEQLLADVTDIGQQHYVNPQERARFRDVLDEHGSVEGFEAELHRRDGSRIWVSLNAHTVRDQEGEVLCYEGTVENITERKQMEKERLAHLKSLENMDRINRAIQENNDLEQMMSDVLDVMLAVFECDRAYLLYPSVPDSDTWAIPMERNRPEYPGVMELGLEMPMTEEEATTARLLQEAASPVTFGPGGNHPLPIAMAERFGFRSFMAIALNPRIGKPWQFGIHQCSHVRQWTDDEKRLFKQIGKRLEDALAGLLMYRNLQESEQRYRMVFENSPVSIWEEDFSAVRTLFDDLKKQGVTDIESYFDQHPETVPLCAESVKVIDVNRAALALRGAANKEELLAGLVNTFTPESFHTFRRELVRLWNAGTEMTEDSVVRTLAGDSRNVTVYFSVCPGHEETLSKVLVSLTDITKRKQTEQELAKYREHLEELIRDRTTELVEARDRAEAASQAKTTFLANMSHELRTPLNAVIGYAQVLRMRHDDDSALCDALAIIQHSGDHLLTLINDILDISIIESGKINLSPTTIHFATFLESIANIIRLRADAKHLAFQMQTPDTLPLWVAADERRLRQILLNLLSNAVKFTPAGQVALRLERRDSPATAHATRQALLRFEVSDTGIGIEPEQIDRIFEPFEQIRSVEYDSGGTGLGLAISRQLVQLMGAELHVESKPGSGSAFWFEVALAVTGPAGHAIAPRERVISGYSGHRRRVLIADDIASNRGLLVEMLASVGFETIEAMDVRQAIHLARETRPDLILIDRRMPGSNGFQAAPQIRKIAGLEKVIIIAVTADVSEQSKAMYRQLGVNAFLPKPVYWPRLAALLEKHMKIEWVYARNVHAQSAGESQDLVPPSPEELNILYELARRGNLRAIEEQASRLETMDVGLRPFARRLRQLAQAFEDRAVVALIEQYIEESEHGKSP